MFLGWMRYAGREVFNVARTLAYANDAGLRPAQTDEVVWPDGRMEGFEEVLGDEPYRTPRLDDAPWYVLEDDATHGFAGVLPLDVSGLGGSTWTANSTELLGDGGITSPPRRSSRTVSASALLVGVDDAAVHAGMEWLSSVLHRVCEPSTPVGPVLEVLTSNPAPLTPTEDEDAALVAHPVDADHPDWATAGGSYDYAGTYTSDRTVSQIPTVFDALDGGTPASTGPDGLDGGTPAAGAVDSIDGGVPGQLDVVDGGDPDDALVVTLDGGTPTDVGAGDVVDGGGPVEPSGVSQPIAGLLIGPVRLGCLSRVLVTWTVTPKTAEPVTVAAGMVDEDGYLFDNDQAVTATGPRTVTFTRDWISAESWRPALRVSGTATIALSVSYRPNLPTSECVRPYRRTFSRVDLVAGPTITAELPTDDCGGVFTQVEWTWTVGDAYRYLDAVDLVEQLPITGAGPVFAGPGVGYSSPGTLTADATACARPVAAKSCALDPTRPGWVTPPVAPLIGDTLPVTVSTYRRSLLQLDPSVVPAGEAALTMRLLNDGTAKRGIRIRTWPADDPDFTLHDECGWESESWVDYIDPGAQLVIDTVTQAVTVVCANGTLADASTVMRGPYRGSFTYPTIRCNRRYFIALDTPTGQGTLKWSLSASTREG